MRQNINAVLIYISLMTTDAEHFKKSIFKRQQEQKSLLHKYSCVESEEVNKAWFRKISPVVSWVCCVEVADKMQYSVEIFWHLFMNPNFSESSNSS